MPEPTLDPALFIKPVWMKFHGFSMFPLLRPGDQVRLIPPEPGFLRIGQIVVFQRAERLVIHRIVEMDGSPGRLVTMGDASLSKDQSRSFEQILALASMRRRGSRVAPLNCDEKLARASILIAARWQRYAKRGVYHLARLLCGLDFSLHCIRSAIVAKFSGPKC